MFQGKKDNFLELFGEVDITLSKTYFWYPGKYVNYITLGDNERLKFMKKLPLNESF